MKLQTSNIDDFQPFLEKLIIPTGESHKGQNGKALIIGGSELFHAASLWAAEIASHFLDMLHYSSTVENLQIFTNLKTKFRNGIIVHKKDILDYVKEDDAILIGPGMIRSEEQIPTAEHFSEILEMTDEAVFAKSITYFLIKHFPEKRFVFDAGSLQMMDKEWLTKLKTKAIVTPHQGEFQRLFGEDVTNLSIEEKAERVKKYAKEYNCVILLKAITDIISDGEQLVLVEGGNQGLTKGGSGDILAGLTTALFTKNDPLTSALIASFLVKRAADEFKTEKGYWYNMNNLVEKIPEVLTETLSGKI